MVYKTQIVNNYCLMYIDFNFIFQRLNFWIIFPSFSLLSHPLFCEHYSFQRCHLDPMVKVFLIKLLLCNHLPLPSFHFLWALQLFCLQIWHVSFHSLLFTFLSFQQLIFSILLGHVNSCIELAYVIHCSYRNLQLLYRRKIKLLRRRNI